MLVPIGVVVILEKAMDRGDGLILDVTGLCTEGAGGLSLGLAGLAARRSLLLSLFLSLYLLLKRKHTVRNRGEFR